MLVAAVVVRAVETGKIELLKVTPQPRSSSVGLLATAILLGQRLLPKPILDFRRLVPMGLSLLLGTARLCLAGKMKRTTAVFAALCAAMAIFMLAAVLDHRIAARSLAQPAADLGAVIRSKALPGEPVYTYGLSPRLPSLPRPMRGGR